MVDARADRARIGDPWRPGVHERACEDVDLRLAQTRIGRRASCAGHKSPWAHGWPRRARRPRVAAYRGASRQVHATSPCRPRSWLREITIPVRLVTARDRQVSRPQAMPSCASLYWALSDAGGEPATRPHAAVHDLGARHLPWSAVCSIELPAFAAVVAQIEYRLKVLRLH